MTWSSGKENWPTSHRGFNSERIQVCATIRCWRSPTKGKRIWTESCPQLPYNWVMANRGPTRGITFPKWESPSTQFGTLIELRNSDGRGECLTMGNPGHSMRPLIHKQSWTKIWSYSRQRPGGLWTNMTPIRLPVCGISWDVGEQFYYTRFSTRSRRERMCNFTTDVFERFAVSSHIGVLGPKIGIWMVSKKFRISPKFQSSASATHNCDVHI
jgi:hypothetical protein